MKRLYLLFLLITPVSISQNIKKYLGKHRILIISTNDKNNADFINQIELRPLQKANLINFTF
ncbi:hypothetical protein BST83_02190 [Polaribacter filamentus]|uniref:Uncharacterized protein n=1 Tax=Polaribacter filamentus TaxID=53483 RepID=A0A2S7KU04_9FLAO|nr:hypothetical protein [Polaribacter filamentus]PQB06124.1 hypothetical protein BST83_02190 [Polaribacter filamentus]